MSLEKNQSIHVDLSKGTIRTNGNSGKTSKAVCGVCNRMYRNPKLLPCLHTFCADCVRQLEPFAARVNGDRLSEDTVLCPDCDSEVDLPPAGVDGLTTDHLALDEVFAETLLIQNNVLCDLCSDGDAGKRCEVCCVNLCDFCSQAHR